MKKKNGKKKRRKAKIKLFGKTLKAMGKEMARREGTAFKRSRESGQAVIDVAEAFEY